MSQNIRRQAILAAPGQEYTDIRERTFNRIVHPEPTTIAKAPQINHMNGVAPFRKIRRSLLIGKNHTSM